MPVPRPLRPSLLPLSLALLVLPARLAGQAQATTGVIRGTVHGLVPAAPPWPAPSVTLRNAETNAERVLTTNERGVYVATLLRVGTYDVTARALGFQESKRTGLALRLGETLEVPFALAPQAVQLAGDHGGGGRAGGGRRPGRRARPGSAWRRWRDCRTTAATSSTSPPSRRTSPSCRARTATRSASAGQRGIHNNVSVDGADFNNPFFGEQRGGQRPAFTFNLDAVQDFVVVADGANAEFGRSSGGFVNVITKSGTNEFHGSAHYFGKYDALSADFNHTSPSGAVTGFTPDFAQHQFGATLGGPLVRDKAFFFLAYDQQEYNETKQTDRLGLIDPALRGLHEHRLRRRAGRRLRLDQPHQRRQRPARPSSTSG